MTKRLEKGTFSWPEGIDVKNGKLQLSHEALALLLNGVDMRAGSFRPWYQR
jgi:IS66 Orf2 like protein.